MIEESDIIEWRKGRISKFIPPNLHQVTFHCQNGEIEKNAFRKIYIKCGCGRKRRKNSCSPRLRPVTRSEP
jgi:hypothetical protein